MLIDKEVIENCKRAIEYFKEFGEQEVYLEATFFAILNRDKIKFLVTRSENIEVYNYWSDSFKEFHFTEDLLDLVEKADEKKEAVVEIKNYLN